uniref:Uncharacterized protein n=1 Tax=Arundo donax TaxID=35708 RepID=A0A0A9FII7_ARUDO
MVVSLVASKIHLRCCASVTRSAQTVPLLYSALAFPRIQRQCLALVRATFVLWLSARNPTTPLPLDLTVESMIMSSSSPWKPSTDLTLT